MIFLFNWQIVRFHVNFRGCSKLKFFFERNPCEVTTTVSLCHDEDDEYSRRIFTH